MIEYKRSTILKILVVGAEFIGLLLGLIPFLIGFLSGTGIEFVKARKLLELATSIQNSTPLIFWLTFLFLLGIIGGFIWYHFRIYKKGLLEQHAKKMYIWDGLRILGGLVVGYLIYELIVYLLIDQMYFRGAFVSLSYLYAFGIIFGTCVLSFCDFQVVQVILYPIFTRLSKTTEIFKISIKKTALNYVKMAKNLSWVILGFIFVFPSLIPVMGLAPSPDPRPATGYGNGNGPFEVDEFEIINPLSEDITECIIPYNDDNAWYIYMYLPRLSDVSLNSTQSVPIALYCHGYSGRDPVEYDYGLRTLASRGMAVIFVQYAAYDVNTSAVLEKIENATENNNPTSYIRYNMTWNGFYTAVNTLVGNNSLISSIDLNDTLGSDYVIDLSRILILGHSYGGGMTPFIGSQVVSEGWASMELIFDLEAPTTSSKWPAIDVNLSVLPDHTMVNVMGYEDDMTLSPCLGMTQHERFFTRDNSVDLGIGRVAYLLIRSDRHGFPRLVATHYLPNDPLINSLSQFGYYRRIDAMAGFLVAIANGFPSVAVNARTYFQGGGDNMIDMGYWSDGTPILPLLYSTDPWGHRSGPNIWEQLLNPDHPSCQ